MSTKAFGEHVHVMDHPLVAHKLTIMRDKNTSVKDFRELVSEIGMLITYEATRDLPLTTKTVETPICTAEEPTLAGKKIAVVPILRAGLGLVDGVLRMVPSARVGHIGMFRDEETLEPHVYFCKMPKDIAERDILIVDPMLATGGSADAAIAEMKKRGCHSIKLMVLEIQETKDMEHGLTLPQLVDRLREKAADPSTVTEYVDDGLASLGLNLYSGLVSQTAFRIGTISTYRVEDGFPRIETGTIPAGVSNLTYHISRSNLTPYLQSESTSAMVEE